MLISSQLNTCVKICMCYIKCMRNKTYNWLTQNTKMRKSTGVKVYNWGIPAFKSDTGFKTCPMAGICAKGCYATMGAYKFSNVAKVFEKRLKLTQSNDFVNTIDAEIKRRKIKKVRIHDSGDFYSLTYFLSWRNIMHLNPDVEFYAYTKMVKMFKALQNKDALPENFTLIYSFGGKQDNLINIKTDRHSKVFENISQVPSDYIDASDDDNLALTPNKKIALVYHGIKNYSNTLWDKTG